MSPNSFVGPTRPRRHAIRLLEQARLACERVEPQSTEVDPPVVVGGHVTKPVALQRPRVRIDNVLEVAAGHDHAAIGVQRHATDAT